MADQRGWPPRGRDGRQPSTPRLLDSPVRSFSPNHGRLEDLGPLEGLHEEAGRGGGRVPLTGRTRRKDSSKKEAHSSQLETVQHQPFILEYLALPPAGMFPVPTVQQSAVKISLFFECPAHSTCFCS